MSLQHKANAFFGNQNTSTGDDEVEDIFEQYGSGAAPVAQTSANDDVSMTASSSAMAEEVETRAWEREFAQQDADASPRAQAMITPTPAPHMSQYDVAPTPAPMPTADADVIQEPTPPAEPVSFAPEEVAQAVAPSPTIDPIATHVSTPSTPPLSAQDVSVTPTPEANEDVASEPVPTSDLVTPQRVEEQKSAEEPPSEEPERSPRYTERVAAPVHRNINAVIENAPNASVKKSVTPHIPQALPQTVDPSKKTILIVDDDVDTLEMYATIFENADYNVLRAADGLEALSIIASYTPHVIFTGVVMPRMDGFTMIDALRQNARTSEIPIVINSHLGRAADKKRSEELGVRDFIVRGFTTPREVVERIGALLLRSEYAFHFDINNPEARKLAKDLGADNFFLCPRGQEMVIKLSIVDPREMTFSARFSCVDAPPDKK